MVGRVNDKWLWCALSLGLLLRVLWVLLVPVEPVSDSDAYATFARVLANYGVYGFTLDEPGAYWAVGTSAITAGTYLIFGVDNFVGVVILNILSGLVAIYFTYLLANLWFNRITAVVAAFIMAIWPNLIFFNSILSSEIWFIALTLAGLWFWSKKTGTPWINLLLCGVIWGIACYVRPTILLLPIALAMVFIPSGFSAFFKELGKAFAVILLIVLVVLPWSERNTQLFGERVLVSTNFGPNFWMGNNPETTGGYMPLPAWVGGMSETERASALGDIAKQYIRDDVPGFVIRTLRKAVQLHERETIGVVWNEAALERGVGEKGVMLLKLIATGFWYLLLLLALAAIFIKLREKKILAFFHPTIAAWGYFTALHAVIVVEDRYHMPSSPFIAVLAALAIVTFMQHNTYIKKLSFYQNIARHSS